MDWIDVDLYKTIKDFEYTRKAALNISNIMDSEEYFARDADLIYDYLINQAKEISFKDYLKRYIYSMAEPEEDFSDISDEEYIEILKDSFEEKKAPYFLKPTTRKKGKILSGFVTSDHVKRETVFVLGFGLSMGESDVREFLTKVNLDRSIDFCDPEEVICWFCYRYGLKYAYAKRMLAVYEDMTPDFSLSEEIWESMRRSPGLYVTSEKELTEYLKYLKTYGNPDGNESLLYTEFCGVYKRALGAIRREYNRDAINDKEEIGPADVEKILCSGVPKGDKGNLLKMSCSTLSKRFSNKRMDRQRISAILHKKHAVERFDLISLLFLIYALEIEKDWPAERYLKYVDEINALLIKCGMIGIYPANPYEAFILMCLNADCPLAVYADVLEKSFENQKI